jgi:hypothetical protein
MSMIARVIRMSACDGEGSPEGWLWMRPPGHQATVRKVLNASWQRCRVHFMRNVLAHAAKSGRRVVCAFIATAFAQDDAEAASAQWRKVADQLRPKLPRLAVFMDEAEADVLAYMSFPAQHRAKLHSTNPIERLNGEIKRRTEVVGIFPMKTPAFAWSAPSCASRTTNGPSSGLATYQSLSRCNLFSGHNRGRGWRPASENSKLIDEKICPVIACVQPRPGRSCQEITVAPRRWAARGHQSSGTAERIKLW